jgi:Tol biopolymer transport system component
VQAGDILGHYRVLGPLGKGGMGEVYAAEDTKLHRRVALKILPAVFATDPERRRRFEREAQTIAALNHPGIVTIHAVEVDGPVPFLTMELIEGQLLRDGIRAGGLPLDVLMKTAIGVTDAVAAAHQRGIVHRDLKPANVIVCGDGRVKVLDFGLAKVHEAEAAQVGDASTHMPSDDLTGEGRIVGTVAYMSPEQAEGKPVDQRSDIFSLGVVLHEMATGERPFKGDTDVSIISSIIKDAPPAITDSRPDLPLHLARIIKRCLIKDPQRRYQSARDLQTDLEDLKQDVDSGVVSASSGVRAGDSVAKAIRIPKSIVYGVAAVFVTLVGVAAWQAIHRRLTAPHMFATGEFQRLTDSGGVFSMALSADGRYVAYSQKENGLHSLWIRQTGTGSKAQIVPSTDKILSDLAFSLDGNFVYYTLAARDSQVATLYRVSVLGGRPTHVLDDVSSNISFSIDGRSMSFRRGRLADGKTTLMVAAADGSAQRPLAVSEAARIFEDMPAPWSPDGRTIIAIEVGVTAHDTSRLVAVDVATGHVNAFGGDWEDIAGVAWMPDGRSVIAAAADALPPARDQLWQIPWPGGQREPLTSGLNEYNNVAVSADGRTVAAIEDEESSSIWVQPLTGSGRQISASQRGEGGAVSLGWFPDGRLVCATFDGGNYPHVWAMDADGNNAKQLATMPAWDPAVSPDGKWIYFSGGAPPPTRSIWKLRIEGGDPIGDPIPVTKGKTDDVPIVSWNSEWIYYTSHEGPLSRTMKIPAGGGPATALTEPEPGFIAVQLSLDGSRLLGFATNPATRRRQAVSLPVNGGSLQFLEHVPSNGGFLPNETGWLFTDTRNGTHGLFLKPLPEGPDRQLADVGQEVIVDFAVSTDSQRVAFIRARETADVVLIKAK